MRTHRADVLEVLRRADRNLAERKRRYDFTDWATCNCGHIYYAATGETGNSVTVSGALTPTDLMEDNYPGLDRYQKTIIATAKALGWKPYRPGLLQAERAEGATEYVSQLSSPAVRMKEGLAKSDRAHARIVIRRAIEKLEAADRRAMEGTPKAWATADQE